MARKLKTIALIGAVIALLAIPATAQANYTHTYVGPNQAMANGTWVGTGDGPRQRTTNRVNRPVGKMFCVKVWFTGATDPVPGCSDTDQPVYVNIFTSITNTGTCHNQSGTYSINVTCWTINVT